MTKGGWIGHTYGDIVSLLPRSEVLDGLDVRVNGTSLAISLGAIENWVKKIH